MGIRPISFYPITVNNWTMRKVGFGKMIVHELPDNLLSFQKRVVYPVFDFYLALTLGKYSAM